jgi:hypothetical protein
LRVVDGGDVEEDGVVGDVGVVVTGGGDVEEDGVVSVGVVVLEEEEEEEVTDGGEDTGAFEEPHKNEFGLGIHPGFVVVEYSYAPTVGVVGERGFPLKS